MSDVTKTVSKDNVYNLDGRVPLGTAIPFGVQHVLAMFVSNLAPVIIVCDAAYVNNGNGFSGLEISRLLQCAMFCAGIATVVQLYPIAGKIGARLPVVMGVSFAFLGSLMSIAKNPEYGYRYMLGAIIVGGIFEGCLGLTAQYWRGLVKPIVSACVVTCIGISLLNVGMNSFAGGQQGAEDFGAWYNMLVGTVTLLTCLIFKYKAKGVMSSLNVLFGLIVGYVLSAILTLTGSAPMIDFAEFQNNVRTLGIINIPRPAMLAGQTPLFAAGPILTLAIVFLVSAAETIGDTTAVCTGGLGRDITAKEISGSLAADGFGSAFAGFFGCCPVTSFSQNVGLIAMTKVVNRFSILMGALVLIICSFFTPLAALFNSLPASVLGGCTILMFGSIVFNGMKMIGACGFNDRNMIIVALAFCIGIGSTFVDPAIFSIFPKIIGDIFAGNMVAGVFVVSMFFSFVLPKEKNEKDSNK